MAEENGRAHDEHKRVQHAEHGVERQGGAGELAGLAGGHSYSPSLLGDARLNGRGNGPVKAAVMRQAQQTYGNRSVQRYLQRCAACGPQEEQSVQTSVQRQTPAGAASEQPATAPSAAAAGGPARVEGSTVDISGAVVNVNAGMTNVSGVLRAGTIIADSVISSTYSPGAGNVM